MTEDVARQYGFGLFSGRYGNIYTARQLRQLLTDCVTGEIHKAAIWERDGVFFDGLRPGIEPDGYADVDDLKAHRRDHLSRVRSIFEQTDVFVFTLGLTEAWQDAQTGLVFPTAPGVMAGAYDPARHTFANFSFNEVCEDLNFAIELMRDFAPKIRVLLTVSPVPLTATASGDHVLSATTYSKSLLRAVAGEVAMSEATVEYFPSYELITGAPFVAQSYNSNLRTVRQSAVDRVMSIFFGAYDALEKPQMDVAQDRAPVDLNEMDEEDALICEEVLLEAFAEK